jgi:hypothetical protein
MFAPAGSDPSEPLEQLVWLLHTAACCLADSGAGETPLVRHTLRSPFLSLAPFPALHAVIHICNGPADPAPFLFPRLNIPCHPHPKWSSPRALIPVSPFAPSLLSSTSPRNPTHFCPPPFDQVPTALLLEVEAGGPGAAAVLALCHALLGPPALVLQDAARRVMSPR